MSSWNALSVAEQTLIRAALFEASLAGTIQTYGAAMRWAGSPEVPARSFTAEEQRQLVPELARVAAELAADGQLSIVRCDDSYREVEVVPPDDSLWQVLADPAVWIWPPENGRRYLLRAAERMRDRWDADVFPAVDTAGVPPWEELSEPQRQILVCAAEASGMLTGAFGIWDDPPPQLDATDRRAWVEQQCDPLLQFVQAGLIEVRHFPGGGSDAYTVIPAESLGAALADPAIRDGDDWGVGVGCVFTYRGLAMWRNAWSTDWNRRLHFGTSSAAEQ